MDLGTIYRALAEVDPYWDEFLWFSRTDKQNMDHLVFAVPGEDKPANGCIEDRRLGYRHFFVNGRWFGTKAAPPNPREE